jgi:transcription initiation factor TFIID subunit 10
MATNQPPDNAEPAQALPNGTQADAGDAAPPAPAIPESRLPTRKDTSLKELLNKMDDYAPIVR